MSEAKDQRKPETCVRCVPPYTWTPRTKGKPKACPVCKSYHYDTPPQYRRKGKGGGDGTKAVAIVNGVATTEVA